MLKGRSKPQNGDASPSGDSQPQFKENEKINARIDEYIKNNPKHWDFIQTMSRDRMARTLVLNEIQKQDRTQKMQEGILRKLDQNPELKKNIQEMVKNVPESERKSATISIARQAMRATTPKQTQPGGVSV